MENRDLHEAYTLASLKEHQPFLLLYSKLKEALDGDLSRLLDIDNEKELLFSVHATRAERDFLAYMMSLIDSAKEYIDVTNNDKINMGEQK